LVDRERIGLSPGAVEGQHQLRAQAFLQWMLGDETVELRDQLPVATECKIRLDAIFECGEPEVLEPCDLGMSERLPSEVRERRPSPEAECCT
jgi:hypothetical protein